MKLYWLDLETTGLDPSVGLLLELAIAEADLERPFDIGPIYNAVFRFTDRHALSVSNPYVFDMHVKNGLLDECAKSLTTVLDAEDHLLNFVPEVSGDDKPTLAGSTVHFDHGFLRAHMPRLAARFSHRHYDVSAVKLFCRSLGMEKVPKAEAHRAADDIRESIEHAKLCVRWLDRTSYLANVCDPGDR
jgi:oligoribonuclease